MDLVLFRILSPDLEGQVVDQTVKLLLGLVAIIIDIAIKVHIKFNLLFLLDGFHHLLFFFDLVL